MPTGLWLPDLYHGFHRSQTLPHAPLFLPPDGGYLVGAQSIPQTTQLLTIGLSDDWSFEKDFLRRRH